MSKILLKQKLISLTSDVNLLVGINDTDTALSFSIDYPDRTSDGPPTRRTLVLSDVQTQLLLEVERLSRKH